MSSISPLLSHYQDPDNTNYLIGNIDCLTVAYHVNELNCVTRVAVPPFNTLTKLAEFYPSDFTDDALENNDMLFFLKTAIDTDATACKLLGKQLGWTPEGEGFQCQQHFTRWLQTQNLSELQLSSAQSTLIDPPQHLQGQDLTNRKILNLNNCKLKSLPPQIGLLIPYLDILDIRNNPFRVSPPELTSIPPTLELIKDYSDSESDSEDLQHYCQLPPQSPVY